MTEIVRIDFVTGEGLALVSDLAGTADAPVVVLLHGVIAFLQRTGLGRN